MNNENDTRVGMGLKIAMVVAVLLVLIMVGGMVLLPMLQTVGGSFGYGFPGGSGSRAIRNVEIDVDPQVIYRIDEHRFFTLENYMDCSYGGFVYYNDTNKKNKIFAGFDGDDKKPQDEFTISKPNGVMSYVGKFLFFAGDDVIAYPAIQIDYKDGGVLHFIVYKNLVDPSKNTVFQVHQDSFVIVENDYVYIKDDVEHYKKYKIKSGVRDKYQWVKSSEMNLNKTSGGDSFHCNDNIKPRSVKFIEN